MLPEKQRAIIDEFTQKMGEERYRVKDVQIREHPTWYMNSEMSVQITIEMEGAYLIEPETGKRIEK
jgi:hypothetical protein